MKPICLPTDILRRRKSCKWATMEPDVIPAWVAETDFAAAPAIQEVLTEMVAISDYGYPTLTDGPQRRLRETFAARERALYGWNIDPCDCMVITDVVQGLYGVVMSMSQENDGVIIQTPIYPPFFNVVTDCKRRLLENPLIQKDDGSFEIDLENLRHLAKDAKILMLCNPHNPTGRVFTRPELEAMANIAMEHNLIIVVDEIHSEVIYNGHTHIPFASLSPEIAARTITVTSATKAFGIPALRCAVIHFGSHVLQHTFKNTPRGILGGVNTMGLHATIKAWDGSCDDWLHGLINQLQENRDRVTAFLKKTLPNGRHAIPEATYLYWIDFRDQNLGGNPARTIARDRKVMLGEGPAFGIQGAGFARLNFATGPDILEEILERLTHEKEVPKK